MAERRPLLLAILCLMSLHVSCDSKDADGGGGGGMTDTATAQKRKLLRSTASRVILPALESLADATRALADAADAHEEAVSDGGDTDASLEALKAAFVDAMAALQRTEMLQIGPAAAEDMAMGGRGLRNAMYSYPASVSTCQVDLALVREAYTEPDFFDTAVESATGMHALEYLIYGLTTEGTCGERAVIRTDGSWDALAGDDAQFRAGQAAYTARLAHGVADVATELRDAWLPDGGNFSAELGGDGMLYDSAQEGLEEVFHAMFYGDLIIKDKKLAIPAGLALECAADTCPDKLESPHAHLSGAHIEENLRSLARLWHAGDADADAAYGWDDLLIELGSEQLADDMTAAIDTALQSAEAMPDDLAGPLADDTQSVRDLHTDVKAITDLMKSQLVTVLGLRVPDEGAGDND